MSEPSVVASGVSYSVADKSLVDDVSLNVTESEFVGVIGPNGAGKSTLLKLLAGDLEPDAGTIEVLGAPVTGVTIRELALRRAMLGASPPSDVPFSVRTVVNAGRNPHLGLEGNTAELDRRIVDDAMSATDVTSLAERSYQTLSSGEQARVLVARVLAQTTPVSMFDEPTASLDLANAESVLGTLKASASAGGTVLCAIHDLNAAAFHCNRLVLLESGKKIADGEPEEVLTGPILSEAYGYEIKVARHPFRDCPLVLPA